VRSLRSVRACSGWVTAAASRARARSMSYAVRRNLIVPSSAIAHAALVWSSKDHRAGIDDFHIADLASVLHVNVAAEEEGCVDCDEHRFGTKVGCARALLIGARRGGDECRVVLRDGFPFGEQAEPLDAFCPELVGGPTRNGVVAGCDHAVGIAAHGDDRVGLLP